MANLFDETITEPAQLLDTDALYGARDGAPGADYRIPFARLRAAIGGGVLAPVRVVAGTNITLSAPGATINGVTMAANDRVLLAAQSTGSQNGIWVWNGAASAMTRPADFDASAKVNSGMLVPVGAGGTDYANTTWRLTTAGPFTLGTTTLTFALDGDAQAAAATAAPVTDLTSDHYIGVYDPTNANLALRESAINYDDLLLVLADDLSITADIGGYFNATTGKAANRVFAVNATNDGYEFVDVSIGALNAAVADAEDAAEAAWDAADEISRIIKDPELEPWATNDVPLIVVAGQSNAEGAAVISDFTALANVFMMETTERVWSAYNGETEGGNYRYNVERLMPELRATPANSIAKKWQTRVTATPTLPDMYIITVARGGTGFSQSADADLNRWHVGRLRAGGTPGTDDYKLPYSGTASDDFSMYEMLVQAVNAGAAEIYKAGKRPRLMGVIWVGGEADSGALAAANEVATNMTMFYNGLKRRWNMETIPFYNVLMRSDDYTYHAETRAGQLSFINTIPRGATIDPYDSPDYTGSGPNFGIYSDGRHYTAAVHDWIAEEFFDRTVDAATPRYGVPMGWSEDATSGFYQTGFATLAYVGETSAGTHSGISIRWEKIGDRVTVFIDMQLTGWDGTGNVKITGLPVPADTTQYSWMGNIQSEIAGSTYVGLSGRVLTNTTEIQLFKEIVAGADVRLLQSDLVDGGGGKAIRIISNFTYTAKQ